MNAGIRRFLACSLLALGLSACTDYSLRELRQATPTGNDFQKALTQHYLKYAEERERLYDWYPMMHFADKGLIAAYGGEVGPESLEDWNIPVEKMPELADARTNLLAVLTPETIEARGEMAALALFSFDCWVNYTYGGWQDDRIGECHDAFQGALAELQTKADAAEDAERRYTVYFQLGQSKITTEAQQVIDQVVVALSPMENYEVVLAGHADRSGGAKANLKLSQQRVQAVTERLVAGGVDAKLITAYAYGASDPQEGSADAAKNRRVEIQISE